MLNLRDPISMKDLSGGRIPAELLSAWMMLWGLSVLATQCLIQAPRHLCIQLDLIVHSRERCDVPPWDSPCLLLPHCNSKGLWNAGVFFGGKLARNKCKGELKQAVSDLSLCQLEISKVSRFSPVFPQEKIECNTGPAPNSGKRKKHLYSRSF